MKNKILLLVIAFGVSPAMADIFCAASCISSTGRIIKISQGYGYSTLDAFQTLQKDCNEAFGTLATSNAGDKPIFSLAAACLKN